MRRSSSLTPRRTSRREVLKALLAAPAAMFAFTDAEAAQAAVAAQAARATTAAKPFVPKFFTATEFRLVRVLADIVIPKDDRSGSATDAGVPEFMDFMMMDQPARQIGMRGGLAWLDVECQRRFDRTFVNCSDAERVAVLDDIAWPARAKPQFAHGVAFFSSFRDLTAAGFWTTRMGIDDLQYMGNRSVARWNGCPPAALEKLGVSYE
ncbi:MAG TPA: gluconate 2-dehydrogenase subunit 3 family protein [Vicinamibacterales bacterium]|nr:gluconate 2-dehydrogenase subunit 3 family protein [Vicinamibacterales bacterium]